MTFKISQCAEILPNLFTLHKRHHKDKLLRGASKHSEFVWALHTAALGSSPKHNIYAFFNI